MQVDLLGVLMGTHVMKLGQEDTAGLACYFPFRALPRPAYGKQYFKNGRFTNWRDAVRLWWDHDEHPPEGMHAKLTIVLFEVNQKADLTNYQKGIEDAIKGRAYYDDSSRYICDVHTTYRMGTKLHGFLVLVEYCDGTECGATRLYLKKNRRKLLAKAQAEDLMTEQETDAILWQVTSDIMLDRTNQKHNIAQHIKQLKSFPEKLKEGREEAKQKHDEKREAKWRGIEERTKSSWSKAIQKAEERRRDVR